MFFAALLVCEGLLAADLEFEGIPVTRVTVSEGTVVSNALSAVEAKNLRVLITREGGNLMWASRGNIPLIRAESGGGYITYISVGGSGYIRVLAPWLREMRDKLPPEEREREFVYMEHLISKFGSVTYFGK